MGILDVHRHRLRGRCSSARTARAGPGQTGGFLLTTGLGIAGAMVATFIGQAVGSYRPDQGAGFIAATLGAIVVLFVLEPHCRVSPGSACIAATTKIARRRQPRRRRRPEIASQRTTSRLASIVKPGLGYSTCKADVLGARLRVVRISGGDCTSIPGSGGRARWIWLKPR